MKADKWKAGERWGKLTGGARWIANSRHWRRCALWAHQQGRRTSKHQSSPPPDRRAQNSQQMEMTNARHPVVQWESSGSKEANKRSSLAQNGVGRRRGKHRATWTGTLGALFHTPGLKDKDEISLHWLIQGCFYALPNTSGRGIAKGRLNKYLPITSLLGSPLLFASGAQQWKPHLKVFYYSKPEGCETQ